MKGVSTELPLDAEPACLSLTRPKNVYRALQMEKTVLVLKTLQSQADKYALGGQGREGMGDWWRQIEIQIKWIPRRKGVLGWELWVMRKGV